MIRVVSSKFKFSPVSRSFKTSSSSNSKGIVAGCCIGTTNTLSTSGVANVGRIVNNNGTTSSLNSSPTPQQQQQQTLVSPFMILQSSSSTSPIFTQQKRNFWSRSNKNNNGDQVSTTSDSASGAASTTTIDDSSTSFSTSDSTAATSVDNAASTVVGGGKFQDDSPSVDATLEKLFAESDKLSSTVASSNGSSTVDAANTASQNVVAAIDNVNNIVWDPTWYNVADQAVNLLNYVHETTGLQYGWSIIGLTIALRIGMLPFLVAGQRASSRMAHLQPELNRIKTQYETIPNPTIEDRVKFADTMKALFKQYEVSPGMAFISPLAQAPVFLGMFFGLKKMPNFFPTELSTGGMYWFTDLTVADPTYVLPVFCSLSFLGSIEINKEQMLKSGNPQQGAMMVNVFRGMAIFMLPVCINFHAAMLCYWCTNNILTMTQVGLLQVPAVKKMFGIWEMPKPVPGQENAADFSAAAQKIMKQIKGEPTTEKQKIQLHNEDIENKKRAKSVFASSSSNRSDQRSRRTRSSRRGRR